MYEAMNIRPQPPGGDGHEFEGSHNAVLPALRILPRSNSVDLVNDPRVFGHNALEKRLTAFRTISIASTFLSAQSSSQMKASLMSHHMTHLQYFGLVLMTCTFILNLFAVIIIMQQIFQVYRLSTSSAMGFDFAKSYYLNPNITVLRHTAVKSFFFSLPIFIMAMACKVFTHLNEKSDNPKKDLVHMIYGITLAVILSSGALLLLCTNRWQMNIFKEKYRAMKEHEQPLIHHMRGHDGRGPLETDV